MRKVLARDRKILVRDRKIVTGIDISCCAGCGGGGGPGDPCQCRQAFFRACPGDAEPSYCCSAKQFDVLTNIRAETLTTVDPSAWGLPLFGYEPVPDAPEDGVMLDGYIDYTNTLSVRCVDGVESIRQIGTIRWGVNYYTLLGPPGASYVDNVVNSGEYSWDVPPIDMQAAIVPVAYGHAVDFNPLAFPASANDHFAALLAILPPLLATQGDCIETYGVGSILTTRAPYVWAPVNFAFGGTQLSGTGTTSADCTFRTSSMRFDWDFLGSGGATYGTSVQTWEMSDQTIVYTECDPDPCDLL